LDVDETIAQLLASEGFTSVEDLTFSEIAEVAEIDGFDDEIADEILRRAQEYIINYNAEMESKRQELNVTDEVASIEALTPPMLVALGEADVKTLDDLADLSGDELVNAEDGILREFGMDGTLANDIVMAARAHWFDDEEAPVEDETPAEDVADQEGEEA